MSEGTISHDDARIIMGRVKRKRILPLRCADEDQSAYVHSLTRVVTFHAHDSWTYVDNNRNNCADARASLGIDWSYVVEYSFY